MAANPKPPTPEQLEAVARQLVDVYREGERRILKLMGRGNLSDWKQAFLKQQLEQVRAIVAEMGGATEQWSATHIPALYENGMGLVDAAFGIDPGMTQIHRDAIELIQSSVNNALDAANQTIGRRVNDLYRQAALEQLQAGLVTGETRRDVSSAILADLRERGVTSFTDSAGREWDMTRYAEMVARTNVGEATRQGTENRLRENGFDLVEVSQHIDPCPVCHPWEGKVLSLTGATDGYPTLAEAEAEGLMHPNCLHDLLPYAPEFAGE